MRTLQNNIPTSRCFHILPVILIAVCSFLVIFTSCSSQKKQDIKIRLGYIQSDLHHLPVFVALEKGFFKEAGLTVEIAGAFRAGPEEMSAFAAKELDVGYVGMAPAITAAVNGGTDIKIIAQVNVEGSALVVKKEAPYTSLRDLKGKTITIPGHATMQDFLLRRALKNQSIGLNEIKVMVLKPPEMTPALAEGDIDAFIAWEPYPSKAVTANVGKILYDSHGIWKNHPCCVVVADNGFFNTYPDLIEKIKSVHLRSCEFINQNQAAAVAIGAKYTGMDKVTVQQALSRISYSHTLDSRKILEYIEFLKELRYINQNTSEKLLMNRLTGY